MGRRKKKARSASSETVLKTVIILRDSLCKAETPAPAPQLPPRGGQIEMAEEAGAGGTGQWRGRTCAVCQVQSGNGLAMNNYILIECAGEVL